MSVSHVCVCAGKDEQLCSRLVTISRGDRAVQDFFHLPSVGLAREVMVPAAGIGVGWRWRSPLYIWAGSPLRGDWVVTDARR